MIKYYITSVLVMCIALAGCSSDKVSNSDYCCCKYLTDDIMNEDLVLKDRCNNFKGECIQVDPNRSTPHPCCPDAEGETCGS